MSMIQVSHLTFEYEGTFDLVFEDVSFQIDTDWKLGFVGRNGRGKTTFLRLLMGEYPYQGHIASSVAFDYFPFIVKRQERDTLEVLEGLAPEAEEWEFYRELSKLEVEADVLFRPFSTLSGGEQTKVLLGALFLKQNNFLLLDEPTNHLDVQARYTVGRYLQSKKGFILVSHDRTLLDLCTDHTLSINKKNIEVQKGSFSSWQENKDRQDAYELAKNERLKKDIKRMEEAAKRTARWSDKVEGTKCGTRNSGLRPDRGYIGHQAAKMMKRSKAIEGRQEEAVREKKALLQNIDEADALKMAPLSYPKQVLAHLVDVSVFYGETMAAGPVSFEVKRGERIALCGKNGCGKSSVLRLLAGETLSHTGIVELGSGLVISYIPQDTSHLKGDLRQFARKEGVEESLFKTILRKLDFSREQFEKDMAGYSEGQKKKVLLSASLCKSAHLYLWDEPLNYIDVLSRMQMERVLLQYCPAMVFVEHDSTFTEKIATRKICLDD